MLRIMFNDMDGLNVFLERSAELELSVSTIFNAPGVIEGDRHKVGRSLCLISREHCYGARLLISQLATSAFAILRLQYECVVRAYWIDYVAKESQIEKLSAELNEDSARRAANNMVTIKDMLQELETAGKAGKAPMQPVEELKEFKDYQMKPLNSFVHSGVHAIQRKQMGYPIPLVIGVLKSSNGLLLMAAMLIVNLSEGHSYRDKLPKVCRAFGDCLPPTRGGS